jgi:Na+/melibiose symporter-like transporter
MKKVFYGFGGLSYSVINQTVSNFFMFFATSVLGLRGTIVGIIVGLCTIWDGVSDSIVGYLSDNYSIGKLGKRNGYMIIATIGMSLFNIALWCVPSTLSNGVKFVWILVSLLLLETFNTMFSTPYSALANDLSRNYDDRTKYNSSNTVFYLLGIMVPSVLLVIFLPNTEEFPVGQLNPNGYFKIAIVTSVICFIFGLLCSIFTREKLVITKFRQREKFSFKLLYKNFTKSFKHKKLRRLILGYVCSSTVSVFLSSVGLHFFTYSFFYSSLQITILLLTLVLGNIASQPFWIIISKKIKKKPALVLGFLIAILSVFGIITVYLFRVEMVSFSFYINVILIFICGFGSGALYTLTVSLYGDAIYDISRGNDNASYLSSLTFAGNVANSVSQIIIGVLLDVIKFDSSVTVQPLTVQSGLALIVFVGIQTFLILGCLIFSGYSEKGDKNI